MNRLEFKIDDWIAGDNPDPRCAGTSAEFVLLVNDVPATRLYDSWSRTVTDRARLPLYPIAEWLAINWWRLHAEAPFEVGSRPPANWRMSHDLPGIGGGLVWPRVRFASDDVHVFVSARALRNAPWEPVRHLNDIPPTPIMPNDFDYAASKLISSVLARLDALGTPAEPLATIWKDVCQEQADPELIEWRLCEARLGYDPDQAPPSLMSQLAGLFSRAGQKAAFEIVPLFGEGKPTNIEGLEVLASAPGLNVHPILGQPPSLHGEPWEKGRTLAKGVRQLLGINSGPIGDADLLSFLGTTSKNFGDVPPFGGALSLGVRSTQENKITLHFRKRNRPGLRFEAARFLAEILTADGYDIWLPQTNRGTARQKLQRAFAAEFLMPIEEAVEQMEDNYTLERFEDVGDRYGVSSLAVRSHLANNGYLNPDDVSASAPFNHHLE